MMGTPLDFFKNRKNGLLELELFFDDAKSACLGMPQIEGSIDRIKFKCSKGVINWKQEIEGLLRTILDVLSAGEASGNHADKIKQLEGLLNRLDSLKSVNFEWLREILWIGFFCISTCFLTYSLLFITIPKALTISISSLIAGGLAVYVWRRYLALNPSGLKTAFMFLFFTSGFGAIVAGSSYLALGVINSITGMYAKDDDRKNRSNEEVATFAKDFLKDNYNMPLSLSKTNKIWLNTYTNLGGTTGSPASIYPSPHICELIYSDRNVDRWLSIDENDFNSVMKKLVVIHEIGHCVTIGNDYLGITDRGELTSGKRSIPASERDSIKTVEEITKNEESKSTQLYREGLADTFAIGFARLNHPNEVKKIYEYMIKKRHDGSVIHRTGCWLKYAVEAEMPNSNADLRDWSYEQVDKSGCSIKVASDGTN